MGIVLHLESFDHHAKDTTQSDAASYEDGFKDGKEAAIAAQTARQAQLNSMVCEALSDSTFGYQEAQTHFLTGMTSYIDAVLETVLPATLCHALHMRLRDLLINALQKDAERPVTLRLPPDQMDAFSAIIADLDIKQLALVADEKLTAHAAFVVDAQSETSLNLDEVLQAIKDHTTILITPSQEVS